MFHVTKSLQPQLIQRLEIKFLESFLQLLELKCMAVEEKQLYLRGGLRPKIEPCLNMLEIPVFWCKLKEQTNAIDISSLMTTPRYFIHFLKNSIAMIKYASIDFKHRLLNLRFDYWWPLSAAEVDRWWAKRKLPWALLLKIEIALSKLKWPWANWNCREQVEIAVSKVEIPVNKLKLPWANWNCRE